MRFVNSVRNSAVMLLWQLLNVVAGFVLRTVFIKQLGFDYLGLNSVMESVLMLLSMAELGIGTSVAFALYGPIERGDEAKIGTLMAFYRRVYHVIAIITAVLGLLLVPFLNVITNGAADVIPNVTAIYLLFLTNTVLSYFFSYRRTLVSAYQLHYINSTNENIFLLIKYILQAVVLIVSRNYLLFLVIQICCVFLSNVFIYRKTSKMYPFLRQYRNERLPKEDGTLMRKSVVSLMFQRLSAALVTGTDNLMINSVGLVVMGIYSNYSMIISTISRVLSQVFQSVIGSVGNLMVQDDDQYKYGVYKEMMFINFAVYFTICVVLGSAAERFIHLWVGEAGVMSPWITFVVLMNFYMTGMRQTNILVIDSSGLFNHLRLKAVLEVFINLAVSFLFLMVFQMGVYGVLLGTTVSIAATCLWWEPYVIFKYAFRSSSLPYFIKYGVYFAVTLITAVLSRLVCDQIPGDGFVALILSGLVSFAFAAAAVLLLFGRTREFQSLWARCKGLAAGFHKSKGV
ncbi:lipopolysaccharide biosynthesis protein [Congzhengia minquanensis]|uniref:Polysaccharide biosynthesis protein n=1 Tax=Congzhengia minquanensis TaxID=2763657 RepID=A0A926DL88_9FIRM|nr:hypothetical protein [Congzhengia minquanensis]MBC8539802.1 hypothetical protein [Congzhengia minquanensis]